MHPILAAELTRTRLDALRREAEHERLRRAARAVRPPATWRRRIGVRLVRAGLRIGAEWRDAAVVADGLRRAGGPAAAERP